MKQEKGEEERRKEKKNDSNYEKMTRQKHS